MAEPKDSPWLDPRLISATPSVFAEQMKYVSNHYNAVTIENVLEAIERNRQLPRKAVLITFDDAYYDFRDNAWPILKRYRLPATVFVSTGYAEQPNLSFWWDRLYRVLFFTRKRVFHISTLGRLSLETSEERIQSLRKLQNYIKTLSHDHAMNMVDGICFGLGDRYTIQESALSWEDLRQLAKEGVTLGAHTRTHPILTQLPVERVSEEVKGSIEDLRREIGNVLPIFAYPNGNYNNQTIQILKEVGVLLAFAGKDGHNNLHSVNPFCLNRTNISRKTSPLILRLRLLRLFTYVDMWRHRQKDQP